MKKVKFKIKPEISKTGCGFFDFDQKAEIFPYTKGELDPDKVFELNRTRFIESKFRTGELIEIKKKTNSSNVNSTGNENA